MIAFEKTFLDKDDVRSAVFSGSSGYFRSGKLQPSWLKCNTYISFYTYISRYLVRIVLLKFVKNVPEKNRKPDEEIHKDLHSPDSSR
jgi:hypothetical protein